MGEVAISSSGRSPSDARRRQILEAAFEGFVRHGYSKITMQEVARAAGVSRPLIYTFYKGKEDLFLAMFASVFADQRARVDAIARAKRPGRDRLIAIFEIVYIELWDKLTGSAEGADLLDAASRLFPKLARGHRADLGRALALIVKNEQVADHLLLSGKGMCYGAPSTQLLRERLRALIDIFAQSKAVGLKP